MNKLKLLSIISVGIFIAIIFERSVFQIPIVFIIMSILAVFLRSNTSYFFVFTWSIIHDAVSVYAVGITAVFIFLLILIINLYERYTGSRDSVITTLLISFSTLIYANYFNYSIFATTMAILTGYLGWYLFYRLRLRDFRIL